MFKFKPLVLACFIALSAVWTSATTAHAEDQVVQPSGVEIQATQVHKATELRCTDAKCAACEAGTCTDADCPVKKCAAGECKEAVCKACEAGTCTGEDCPLKKAAETGDQVISSAASEANLGTPTHRQTKIIKANQDGLNKTKLNCFCMTLDGRILGGCGTSTDDGEIRVFDADGEYVESWSTPVKVEAINVRASDGMVFVAGDGRIVKLDDTGALIANEPSPHTTHTDEQTKKMRDSVIKQLNERADLYRRQVTFLDKQIEVIVDQIANLKEKLGEMDEELDDSQVAEAATSEETADNADQSVAEDGKAVRNREMLTQQITQLERSKTSLEQSLKLYGERVQQMGDSEPSEEVIEDALQAQMARKMNVASLSAVDDKVYVACSASVGYGYSVWSIEDDLSAGEEIISDLRGCCGQMDVQVNGKGIYVAENSRDRVVCFDHQGEEITHWGHSAREGIRGFGSCCNPMNVAFGPESTVYTAESGTGRIKQYTADGQLLQVIGSADLVPGCKKVSIGVSSDGNRVFMLDITRDHIVMMDRIPAEERDSMVAEALDEQDDPSEDTEAGAGQAEVKLELRGKAISAMIQRMTEPAPGE